ncbi:MAG: large subunit ribosomal protein [Patescibacteria group bacterium]|nr:large subunit ribosomal protein [Patescibacteria group bacterium]
MKHLRSDRKLSRDKDQRKALFRTMLGSLIMHEKIETTEAKAKELRRKIDRIINKAKKTGDEKKKLAIVRNLRTFIPAMAVKKITGEFLAKFEKRGSGYARIIKLAPRKSDGAKKAVIEFV